MRVARVAGEAHLSSGEWSRVEGNGGCSGGGGELLQKSPWG